MAGTEISLVAGLAVTVLFCLQMRLYKAEALKQEMLDHFLNK